MKPVCRILLLASLTFFSPSFAQEKEVPIPRSDAGDKGKYYLINKTGNNNIVSTLHKRVGENTVSYTRSRINCRTMKMRIIGYSEISANAIQKQPTPWVDIVPDSNQGDLAHFVCNPEKQEISSTSHRMPADKSGEIGLVQTADSDDDMAESSSSPTLDSIISALVGGFMVYGLLAWRKQEKDRKKRRRLVTGALAQEWKVGDALIQPNWTEIDWTGYRNEAVALDRTNQIFGIIKTEPYAERIAIRFDDMIKSEVIVDTETIMQAYPYRGLQIARRVLAGGVGAIIGGTTENKTGKSKNQVKSVELKVLTTDRIINVPFATANLMLALKWHDLLSTARQNIH